MTLTQAHTDAAGTGPLSPVRQIHSYSYFHSYFPEMKASCNEIANLQPCGGSHRAMTPLPKHPLNLLGLSIHPRVIPHLMQSLPGTLTNRL